jgi:hypothetical protein
MASITPVLKDLAPIFIDLLTRLLTQYNILRKEKKEKKRKEKKRKIPTNRS